VQINYVWDKRVELLEICRVDIALFEGGNACLVIRVIAMNFSLLSADEQSATLYAYAAVLNSLSFPIQIVVLLYTCS
jgi:hypothetical protein